MPRYSLSLLLFVAAAASARAPAPPTTTDAVADRELLRLLSSQYDAKARLRGGWTARGDTVTTRSLCADSGARRGDRFVAVCSTPADVGGGRVDLFIVEPPATPRGRARIRARFRGVDHDPADAVRLMAIAPDRLAFVLDTTTRSAGRTRASHSLYAERADGLRRLLTVGTRLDDTAACASAAGSAGRRCRERRVDLTCTLRADTSRVDAAAWPLELHVSGRRGGDAIDRVLPIPHDAYGYRVSARVLDTQACDGTD
ncbi:hypothetical protein [Cognatilysobacter segetis]|uniref:hypothetical protein n=1 Tax=Cognatilysobacter segetis TaxID=2492394 RepID=UPI001060C624|nr:hypothetical protein [Lysobacter segetis]